MKRILAVVLLIISISIFTQAQSDSLKDRIESLEGKINSMDERLMTTESDVSKVSKIKFSGYIQAQYDYSGDDLVNPLGIKPYGPLNTFYIRRARVKVTYEATDGLKFVLQPDYSTGNLSLKDAYVMAVLPKFRQLALWVGQFNRPNYEVEYSSGQREILERSRVVRTIYPGEREIGAKLEYQPLETSLKLQAALLNGNFTGTEAKDVDSQKDFMGRATYSLKFPSQGIGIDFGAHVYYGGLKAQNKFVSNYDAKIDSSFYGQLLDKKWLGGEMQVYFDLLGGMSIKGEYIKGKNAFNVLGTPTLINPYKIREFEGYYIYLIKNIGLKNQLVVRYDQFDPNTKLSGQDAGLDVSYQTFNFAWQYYLNENIRITLNYEMPKNEISQIVTKELKDNVLGIRFQAKF